MCILMTGRKASSQDAAVLPPAPSLLPFSLITVFLMRCQMPYRMSHVPEYLIVFLF